MTADEINREAKAKVKEDFMMILVASYIRMGT